MAQRLVHRDRVAVDIALDDHRQLVRMHRRPAEIAFGLFKDLFSSGSGSN